MGKAAALGSILTGLSQLQGSTPQSGPGSNQAKIQQAVQNPTIKNLGAANYSAFKAGGGEEALKQQGSSPEALANIIIQGKQNKKQNQKNSYDPKGQVLTESRQRIFHEIKQSLKIENLQPKTGTQSSFSSFSKAAGKVIKFSYEVDGTLLSENYNPYTKSDLRGIKNVRSLIHEQESFQPTSSSEPSEPTVPPLDQSSPEYKGQGMTTGEKPTDYSTSRLTYLQKIDSDGFITGFLSGSTSDELQEMFKGTNINSSSVYSMLGTSQKYSDLNKEYSRKYSETWAKNSPLISIGIGRMQSARDAKDIGGFYTALAEVDRLFAESDAYINAALQASSAWFASIKRLGDYIRSGKINPMDPFNIEDPTVAADKKQKEEKDRKIEKLIAELQAASSTDAQAYALEKLAAIGLSAVVIAVVIVGIALLAKPALIARLGMPFVQRILSALGKNADDLGIGAKADMGAGGLGNITGQLADDAAALINKLSKTDVSGARTLAKQIDDAAEAGNTELLKKLMQKADD